MIVVTGSDGIVGRALCLALRSEAIPFLPITHRRKPHTDPDALVVDLTENTLSLEKYCDDITAIVHLAAAVPHSTDYPDNEMSAGKTRCMDNNILLLQKLTNAQVIYMSTCGLYDRTSSTIKSEEDNIKITTPYFAAKARGETIFSNAGNAIILRLAAPIGAGLKSNLVLSKFIAAARNNKSITIWGSGQREQNYIDTVDLSDLIIQALRSPVPGIVNDAADTPMTMLELAEMVISVLGSGSIEVTLKEDSLDGETARYSINKAKQLYGWFPRIDLYQSIKNIALEEFENNT